MKHCDNFLENRLRCVAKGVFWGQKPPSTKFSFNLLWVFKKKIPKNILNFVHPQKNKLKHFSQNFVVNTLEKAYSGCLGVVHKLSHSLGGQNKNIEII